MDRFLREGTDHDNEGKVTSITYPTDANAGVTPQYNYQYDAMSRPSGMSDQNAATVVSGVLYGAAMSCCR